ncbi:MAG: hypothetical protein IKO48_02325 [Elusimicrobia bacterium]|nr:hypothetical protein [Elusimicrobiota bacterium]
MNQISFKTYVQDDYIVKEALTTIKNVPNVYFKFPKKVEDDLTDRADPFVYALVFYMMQEGGTFEINGNVSKSVMDNITMFCRIWHIWEPQRYKEVEIIANEIKDDYRPENRKMITAFSGGIDAAYTAYKYKKNLDKRFQYDLDRSVMILGADISITNKKAFDLAFSKAKKMTDDLGIELIPVETNFRQYESNWVHCFGTVIVAIFNFFSKKYFYGAAADDSVKHYHIPWGMNPITDRYLSSDTFRFIADGYEHSRIERTNVVKNWKACLENLRVCWRNKEDLSSNCGHCEKCIRTKLDFFVLGVKNLPSMPKQFSPDEIADKNLVDRRALLDFYEESYDYGKENSSMSTDMLKLLKEQINIWDKRICKKENSLIIKLLKKQKNIWRERINKKQNYLIFRLLKKQINFWRKRI